MNQSSFYDTERIVSYWFSNKMWEKVGKEIDKDEWLMTPQTVNAYYTPNTNEVILPVFY